MPEHNSHSENRTKDLVGTLLIVSIMTVLVMLSIFAL